MAQDDDVSRRDFLLSASLSAAASGLSGAAMAAEGPPGANEAVAAGPGGRPPVPNPNLEHYWTRPVSELAAVEAPALASGDAERHRIFSLLTMALVFDAWNGNKRGQYGDYPWRSKQRRADGTYRGSKDGDRYLGHNIACIAVDGHGEIIDFEFNHNELFASSAEHAEARLVRRVFDLNQIFDHWQTRDPGEIVPVDYSTVLNGVTIYTSLESCAQCSGIMTLGNVKDVVYLQTDPGQYLVGYILYNLTRPMSDPAPPAAGGAGAPRAPKYGAPLPIGADRFGFGPKRDLDRRYEEFRRAVTADPETRYFYRPGAGGRTDASPSITSFLCTDAAMDVFEAAAHALGTFEPEEPRYKPAAEGLDPRRMLSNADVLAQARKFRNYVVNEGRRATPHR